MLQAIPFLLGGLVILSLPSGAILLALGLFQRGPAGLCACGYSHRGLKPGDKCPECGGPIARRGDVPRVRWQRNLGIALLVLCAASAAGFVWAVIRLKT